LTAAPKPGYQFVYWLGDVTDPMSNRTIVRLDGPKIVVAVFEAVEHELLVGAEIARSAPVDGLIPSATDYSRRSFRGGGGTRPRRPKLQSWESEGPENPDEFPVPIPEPSTVVSLMAGGLVVFVRIRTKGQG
jgi:hypothetical protein